MSSVATHQRVAAGFLFFYFNKLKKHLTDKLQSQCMTINLKGSILYFLKNGFFGMVIEPNHNHRWAASTLDLYLEGERFYDRKNYSMYPHIGVRTLNQK